MSYHVTQLTQCFVQNTVGNCDHLGFNLWNFYRASVPLINTLSATLRKIKKLLRISYIASLSNKSFVDMNI